MKRVFLSLGSNLGNRSGNIQEALDALTAAGLEVRRVSSFYRTEPVEFRQQPWFINCVAEVLTELLPLQLLKAVQRVEHSLGRRRVVNKGPRTIDIDILLYENVVVRSAALNIPHESMAQRRFVLIPLGEVAPGLRHPVTERTVTEMLSDTADASQVVRIQSPADTGEH
ncbi:MAG: 2-amino-4-hydroxy-6-hydroxymethyldihydropteridine diphosphokinase [Terriglobia bacterium]|jgi:2-amino-4-hydroxy-6-hydroxymethyldihydropteridine diphosphokinase